MIAVESSYDFFCVRFFNDNACIYKDNRDNKNNGKNRRNVGCHEVTYNKDNGYYCDILSFANNQICYCLHGDLSFGPTYRREVVTILSEVVVTCHVRGIAWKAILSEAFVTGGEALGDTKNSNCL